MDNIINVAEREKIDSEEIILYPEGIFYRAYGYSALRFIRHVRPYQVKKRYYKKLGRELCYIGFPQSAPVALPEEDYRTEKTEEGTVVIRGPFDAITPEEYDAWMESIPLSVAKSRTPPPAGPENTMTADRPANDNTYRMPGSSAEQEVLARLHAFALETATPLECMLFLSDLKQRLNG